MNMRCPLCGEEIQLPEEVQEGQHILCPYCNQKFSYQTDNSVPPSGEFVENNRSDGLKVPRVLRILSKILFVVGAWIMIMGAKDWMWPDGFRWAFFFLFVTGVMLFSTAYFMQIGHSAARKTALVSLLCVLSAVLSPPPRSLLDVICVLVFFIPVAVTFLPSARRWLSQYDQLSWRDLDVALQGWKGLSKIWKCVVVVVFVCVIYNLVTPSTVGWDYGGFEGDRGFERYIYVYSIATYDETCMKITAVQRDSLVTVSADKDMNKVWRGADFVFNFDDDAGWKKCKALIREKVRDRAAKQVIARLEKLRREL